MKKIYLLSIILACTFFSCKDFLQEAPPTFISTTNFFKSAGDARAACDAVYVPLHNGQRSSLYGCWWPAIDMGTDDLVSRTPQHQLDALVTHTVSSSNLQVLVENSWTQFWQGVTRANTVIERVSGIDMDEQERNAIVGEARALRGLYYFYLVRTYGDVPAITSEVETFGDFEGLPRENVDVIYEEIIIPDLQYAEDNCKDELHSGRITKWTAKMILADVYLTRAGWRRTPEGQLVEGDASNWAKASQKAYEIIQQSPHDLITEPVVNGKDTLLACGVAWDPYHPFTKEAILELGAVNEAGYGSWLSRESGPFPYGLYFWGNHPGMKPLAGEGVDKTILEMQFPGKPVVSGLYVPTPDLWRAFEEGDERRDWGLMTRYTTPEGDVFLCQPTFRKYIDLDYYMGRENTSFQNTNSNFVVYRFADALLIYAEAANEAEGGPSAEAYAAVNRIRDRAGLPVLPSGLSRQEFREAVWRERRAEFHGECKRRFDLIRTNRLKAETDTIDYEWQPSDNPPYLNASYVNANAYGIAVPWPDQEWLLPLPVTELSINKHWKNNEGY